MSLEEETLQRLKPSRETIEQVDEAVRQLRSRIQGCIDATGLGLRSMLVGSVAKGTYVGRPDIDLFILFPEHVERAVLEKVGLSIGDEVLGGERRYAEHPYTHGKFMGFEVDLVPCYAVEDAGKLRSAVDRTPFHTIYVLERLSDHQRDQVLLLKQFMKGVGVYGAEARVQGFSGYLTELLVLRYGSFEHLIKEALDWKPGISMNMEGSKRGQGSTPMTFDDPVDPKRNVASALGLDSFCMFLHACQEYAREPDERFFFPRQRPVWTLSEIRDRLKDRGSRVLVVTLERPDLVDDNLYPQVQRTRQGLQKLLESYDFRVLDSAYDVGADVRMVFEMESVRLPAGRLHRGPPAWTSNAQDFVAKWRENGLGAPFLKQGIWMAHVRREFQDPAGLIDSKGGEAALGNGFRELKGMQCAVDPMALQVENRSLLTRLLDKRENWRV